MARCPAHDDRTASLKLTIRGDGALLLFCHARCDPEQILVATGLTWSDLMPERRATESHIVAQYLYRSSDGQPLRLVKRTNTKQFPQFHWDAQAGWVPGVAGVPLTPYRVDELKGSRVTFICEGEKDVNRLWSLGLPATTGIGGAGKWLHSGAAKPHYAAQLKAIGIQRVAILPDHDPAGFAHAKDAALDCEQEGLEVRIVELPELPPKGDISDWLDAGHSVDELKALTRNCPIWTNGHQASRHASGDAFERLKTLQAPISSEALRSIVFELASQCANLPALDAIILREQLIREFKRLKCERPAQLADAVLPLPAKSSDHEPQSNLWISDVIPWSEAVDGASLLADLTGMLERYIAFPSERASTAIALWIIHTYLMDCWFISPFLLLSSPTKRCGKTLLLLLLERLVNRPWVATNITPAVLFRAVDCLQPTLLLDEVELWLHDKTSELRGLLNAGYSKPTARTVRCVGDDQTLTVFSTWAPKVFAMIGRPNDTLLDRSISIRMQRRRHGDAIERMRLDQLDTVCEPLRQRIKRWTADHGATIKGMNPDVPETLNDRAADNWRGLFSLAELLAGEAGLTLVRAAAFELEDIAANDETGILLLEDIRTYCLANPDEDFFSTSSLLYYLKERTDRPWNDYRHGRPLSGYGLSMLLKSYGIVPVSNRSIRGYRRSGFDEVWLRYLGDIDMDTAEV
jgi:Protein of unknown function (DUF3631)